MAKVSLKLVVDKKKKRVVFAESDKDFADILFSFLTLPMGTIVRLLGKKSGVGCMDKLYDSVENLDTRYLQTAACKSMLLQPRGPSEGECEDLLINVDDLDPTRLYRCSSWDCVTKTHCLFSNVSDTRCRCGQVMIDDLQWTKQKVDMLDGGPNAHGVFVKGTAMFMISDDLQVMPISTGATFSLLQRLGIKDPHALETMSVDVSMDQVLSLLKRMLLSKTPLTDVFLTKEKLFDGDCETNKFKLISRPYIKSECDPAKTSKTICVRLVESKSTNDVVFAEAGGDLVDILFSFLTFPLGSVVMLLNDHLSPLGCVHHLYHSANDSSNKDYIKSEGCKHMLLSPKLASHFGCSNQLLVVDAKQPRVCDIHGCKSCFEGGLAECSHGVKDVSLTKINPKLPITGTDSGGGFTSTSFKFMVTNEMMVTPLSPVSSIAVVKELDLPITSLVEREISCGETEVLNLLKACMTCRTTVLFNAFSCKKSKKRSLD